MMQDNYVRLKYDSINSLDDIKTLISNSKDGETPWLEFKGIKKEKNTQGNSEFIRHQKSLLAKEICAFLNTSGGIIAWGIEYVKDKNVEIVNDFNGNIYDLLDGCIQTIIQPIPSGVDFKIISDGKRDALLIFIPKSKFLPHRVWDNAESGFARNYYARSGTSSIPLDEGIVRALYLTDGRIPKISVFTEPRIESEDRISLNVLAEPDSVYYVDHYYDNEKFLLLDKDGNVMENEENKPLWTELKHIDSQVYPIYPSITPIPLFSHDILLNNLSAIISPKNPIEPKISSTDLVNDIELPKELKYIFTKSDFACNGVQLTTDKRLYILNSITFINTQIKYGKKDFHFNSKKVFEKIEKKYDLKIFVLDTYSDEDIMSDLCSGALTPSQGNKLTLSSLDQLLDRYSTIWNG